MTTPIASTTCSSANTSPRGKLPWMNSRTPSVCTVAQIDPRDHRDGLMLLSRPRRVHRGHCMKRFQAASEFEVLLELTLHRLPSRNGGIIDFSIKSKKETHLPSLYIEANTCHLIGIVAIGRFCHEIRSSVPVRVGQSTCIGFRLFDGMLTLAIGDQSVSKSCTDIYLVGDGTNELMTFLCGPKSHAADATVNSVEYRWRPDVKKTLDEDDHKINLDLPNTERDLLDKLIADEKEDSKWRKFDSFFGFALVVNSIWIGVGTAYIVPSTTNALVENTFLSIFLAELLLRSAFMGKSMHLLFMDPWCIFDAFIIGLTFFDLWIAGTVDLPFPVGVLRLLRLLKLIKMVRLVRAFKSLSILVEGMLHSAQTLFWTLLLLFISVYIWSILLKKLWEWSPDFIGEDTRPDTGFIYSHNDFADTLKTLVQIMWQLLRMATFGDWGAVVRTAAFESGIIGTIMSLCFLSFMSFCALGILNMLIGVMSLTAFRIETRNRRLQGAKNLLNQQDAVLKLRTKLKTFGKRPLFTSDRWISFHELFEAIGSSDIAETVETLHLDKRDFIDLGAVFEEGGQIEIDGLIEAIVILQLQRYFEAISAGQALSPNVPAIREMDMLSFAFATKAVERNLHATEQQSFSNCSLAYDVVRCLHERSRQANTILPEPKSGASSIFGTWEPPIEQLHRPPFRDPTPVDIKSMSRAVHLCNMGLAQQEISMPVDLVFGVVICLNTLFLGFQVTYGGEGSPYYMPIFFIDNGFTLVFTLEFLLRSVLHANFQDLSNHCQVNLEDANSSKHRRKKLAASDTVMMEGDWNQVQQIRKTMILGIFVRLPEGGIKACVAAIPAMLLEPWLLLDFLIISLCIFDALVITQLRNAGTTDVDPSVLTLLRFLRICRLSKVLRVFRVFPQLQMLVFALRATAGTIFWTIFMTLMGLYIFALVMFALVGRAEISSMEEFDSEYSEGIINFFGSLASSFLTGWQLITFDEWSLITNYIFEDPEHVWTVVFIGVIQVTLGCGILKIAVGIMCESAVNLVKVWAEDHQREDLVLFFRNMNSLKSLMMNATGSYILTHRTLEDAMGVKFRTPYDRDEKVDEEARPFSSVAEEQLFLQGVRKFLVAAKLSSDEVKLVFELLDYERWGCLHIDQFIAGALELKEDITKLSIFAMTPLLHYVLKSCAHVSKAAESLHWKMDALLEQFAALIHRANYEHPPMRHHYPAITQFTAKAQKAIEILQTWNGHGPLPAVKRLGKLEMREGTGQVQADAEIVIGVGTRFRQEVKPGDMIVVENHEFNGRALVVKTTAIMIGSVVTQELMKVQTQADDKNVSPGVKKLSKFKISKKKPTAELGYGANVHDNGSLFEIKTPDDCTPRTSQHLFEWELHTKKCAAKQVNDALDEHRHLSHEMIDLEQELQTVIDTSLKLHIFRGWCAAVDWSVYTDKRQTRTQRSGNAGPEVSFGELVGKELSDAHHEHVSTRGGLNMPALQQVSSLGRAASQFIAR